MFELQSYLARIGTVDVGRADLPTLTRLHRAHSSAIPFENLDIQMRRPIALDAASLQAALVHRRRGGYCFQQNALFRLALRALGYQPRSHEGRVFDPSGAMLPRTHMVLTVAVDGIDWLVDVGFGGLGIVEPITLDGTVFDQDGWRYRVVLDGRFHLLDRARIGGWDDLYRFTTEPAEDVDYVVGNWYTSTHPDSKFVRTLTVQRMLGRSRHVLRGLVYSVATGGGDWQTRTLARNELVPVLRDVFGLDVPDDARFRALDDGS